MPSCSGVMQVPHALVDCCDLPDFYSAARWAKEAQTVISRENSAGRLPLIVGGTGFYLKALLHGFADIPAAREEVRLHYEQLHKKEGAEALYAELQRCDAVMASRLHGGDTQRVMRALCVLKSSGHSLAWWQQQAAESHQPIDCPLFVLELPRALLRERLAVRFNMMMDAGLLDEVRWLKSLRLADTHPAMRAVGYRQLLDYLQGELSLERAVETAITATRRYAKRQVTWFKHQGDDALHGSHEVLYKRILEVFDRYEP